MITNAWKLNEKPKSTRNSNETQFNYKKNSYEELKKHTDFYGHRGDQERRDQEQT